MRKTIKRRLQWTPDEIMDALIDKLRENDHPYPDTKNEFTYQLSEDGAVIEWTELS